MLAGTALIAYSQVLFKKTYVYFAEGVAGLGSGVLSLSSYPAWNVFPLSRSSCLPPSGRLRRGAARSCLALVRSARVLALVFASSTPRRVRMRHERIGPAVRLSVAAQRRLALGSAGARLAQLTAHVSVLIDQAARFRTSGSTNRPNSRPPWIRRAFLRGVRDAAGAARAEQGRRRRRDRLRFSSRTDGPSGAYTTRFSTALTMKESWARHRVSRTRTPFAVPIPERGTRVESCADAFFYLLAFITLGFWTVALVLFCRSVRRSRVSGYRLMARKTPRISARRSQVNSPRLLSHFRCFCSSAA